ncbi:hypothetical protein GA0115251_10045 [Streptomyces sp. TverLS-915]|uniref:hypothetical protein n=1 Tax=Streptomyces sp. TverLS-915 TaxID=1839763 RepID=UPI00081DBD4A|nr:hypothetical protein [Streptomyces sp. TverLS-915]SCD27274.1 hypothetical protein GA0115251_10045 [Streptomyces sp. TverLS-915]
MISPGAIPQFTGDFEQLDKDASALQSDAIGIRDGGADVHSRFQALAAFYEAPEAEELFATTRPVMDGADTFATKLETVAGALQTYAAEARPQADRLEQLKTQAFAFVESVEDDDDWTEDEGKVERHKALMDGVAAAQAAFQEAERRAANTISALVGGPRFVEDNGDHTVDDKTVMYGYGLDRLQHAEELPWGTPEERTYERWSLGWWGHGVKSFVWDGLIIDNIGGALDGLWTLVGGHGWGKAGDAWSGLGDVFGGISAYIMTPYDWAMDQVFGPAPPDATTERQKKALREFGKGLVAWDQWGDDPARASATVVFNFGTLFLGPAAAASKAGKGGAAAKTAANVAKVIDHLDPVAAGIKAAGKVASHLPKLSELPSRLLPASRLAEDGTPGVHTIVEAPDGSYVRIEDGEFVQYDKNGHRVESEAPSEQSPERQPATTPAPHREPAMVGARPRTPEAHAHVADDAGTTPGRTDPAGHTRGHETEGAGTGPARTGDGPAAPPARSGGGGGHGEGPSGSGHGENSSGGRGDSSAVDGRHGSHAGDDSTASTHEGAGGDFQDGPGTEGISEVGGDGSGTATDWTDRLSEGERTSQRPSGPMLPAQEAAVSDALKRAKMPPQDLERALVQLRKNEYGRSVAEYIVQGKFDGLPGYYGKSGLLFQSKQAGMIPAVHQAMELAAELQKRGVEDLAFEYKAPAEGLDLDVLVKSGDDIKYGVQLKDVSHEGGIGSAAKKIAKKGLRGAIAGPKVAILDVHDTKAALTEATVREVEHYAERTGATYELRFEDGSVTIPPAGQIYP